MKTLKKISRRYLKLKKEIRTEKPWLFRKPLEFIIDKNNPPILVYQMGKVGSTSVVHSLRNSGLMNPVYHTHQLSYEGIDKNIEINRERLFQNRNNKKLDDHTRVYTELFVKYVIRKLKNDRLLRKKIDKNFDSINWKIITLVRDPVMREISNFFFTFHKHPEIVGKKEQLLNETSLRVLKDDLNKRLGGGEDWSLTWFDRELKKVFGVDMYRFPFDHENGYTLIHSKNISILVIKLEELGRCFSGAIFELLNKENLNLTNSNVAGKKFYYNTYRYVLENLTLDSHFCKKIYSSKYARHFYTNDELKIFMRKWSGRQV